MPLKPTKLVEHPAWCQPKRCTTPAEQPTEPQPDARWTHRSDPVPLSLHRYSTVRVPIQMPGVDLADRPTPFSAWLEQPLRTGWGGGRTFLHIGVDGHTLLSLDLSSGGDSGALDQLAELVTAARTDIEASVRRELADVNARVRRESGQR